MLLFRIIQGWFYYFFRSKRVESLATKREQHCLTCIHAKFYAWEDEWKHKDLGYPKKADDLYCTKCMKCPISKKIRSPREKCPVGKW